MSTIKTTRNYAQFRRLKGNREIDKNHLARLIKSVEQTGVDKTQFPAITVNEKLEVVDGQHRLEVCKHYGIPIDYIIKNGAGLSTVHVMNTNVKQWTAEDFLISYIEKGYKEYILYKDFKDTYGFSHQIVQLLLGGMPGGSNANANLLNIFKAGLFVCKNIKQATNVADKLIAIADYYDGYNRRSFVYAMVRCLKVKEFDFARFMHKLQYQQTKMVHCASVEQYMALIEDIYNYNAKASDKLNLRITK